MIQLSELNQHCGNCGCIDYCAEPYEDLCLCCDYRFEKLTDAEYKQKAKNISIGEDKKPDESYNEYIARKVYEQMQEKEK